METFHAAVGSLAARSSKMNKMLYVCLLFALILWPAGVVHADDGKSNGRLVIGQDYTLRTGETLDGDLVVIGGLAVVESGATVRGDVVIIGGSFQMDGQSTGSTIVIGGSMSLGMNASVAADVVALGGSLNRAEGAKIGGDVITNWPVPTAALPDATLLPIPSKPPAPRFELNLGPLGTALKVLFQSLVLAALAMLLTAFLHPQLDRVAQAITTQPFLAGSVGLLTTILAPLAIVLLTITLILIPVALAGTILLALAWLFGVVAIGLVVGHRLMEAFHGTWEPVLASGAGAFAVGLVVGLVGAIPCVGWMAPALVGLLALGAAVMTLFGTRNILKPNALAISGVPAQSEGTPPPTSMEGPRDPMGPGSSE
jgi:hypothetical protein